MFPVLFSLGSFTLYTFSIFLGIAFFLMAYVFWMKGKEEHYTEDEMMDVLLVASILGVIASRVGFIVFHLDIFGVNPIKWLDVVSIPGNLPLFGLGAAAWYVYHASKKLKWNAFEVLDFAAIAVALGMCVTWLGAFFAGTGFGYPTELPWGMNFPNVFDKRHPTQLYGFGAYFMLFVFLMWAESRYRTFSWYREKHSAQTGFLFCSFCIAYGIFGVVFSFLMPNQLLIQGFPLDLPVRVVVFLFGVAMLYLRSGRTVFRRK